MLMCASSSVFFFFFFQAEDGIRDLTVTGVQTCALPISARRETRGAGRVPVPLGAETLVRRAVLQPARRADAHVLVTSRLSIHPALGDAVVRAEVLGAYRATVRARLAGAVVVPADDKQRRRATALRARPAPGRPTGRAQGPLGAAGGVMPAGRGLVRAAPPPPAPR